MKQILVHEPGGPEAMTLADVPTPAPPPGHVLVAIHVSGVNFLDVYFRSGLYKSDHPIAIGSEAAGVDRGRRRRRQRSPGGRARRLHHGAWHLRRVRGRARGQRRSGFPDALTFETAAAVLLQGTTAHYLTRSTFPLNDTHTCLVHAAAGGAGGLVVQMAKARGRAR